MTQEHEPVSVPAPATGRDRGSESISELIRNLASELSVLFGKEISLAKSEVRESVSEVKTAVGSIATGAVIAMAGVVVLLMSAVYGLSNILDPWLAALIVGAAALLIGYLMVRAAKEAMSSTELVPDRTVEAAKKDQNTLRSATR